MGDRALDKAKALFSWTLYSGQGKELKERKNCVVHYVVITAKDENKGG